MSKNDVGIIKLPSGLYAYRFAITIDGHTVTEKKTVDADGKKLYTKTDARKAREAAIIKAHQEVKKKKIIRKTVEEVYDEYKEVGCIGKAYRTLQKQDSLWKNHIKDKFGKRYIDDIAVAEVNDYLAYLYYEKDLAYKYVESFLKMFYLIFGQAYSRDYLDLDTYSKLCKNPSTKIHMPKQKIDEEDEIVVFSKEELDKLDEYFKNLMIEPAYLLGKYCGLRINEVFGLKWDHINFERGTIFIDRQQQYQEGLIKLVPVKTKNAVRTIYMCDKLKSFLQYFYDMRNKEMKHNEKLIEQRQRFIDDLDGKKISSTELVLCLFDGTIQTVNSFKYHSREIKSKLSINFKFHFLRHTYGTMMAELNTPEHLLCQQMGHGSIKVTHKYYLSMTKIGEDILKQNLNQL